MRIKKLRFRTHSKNMKVAARAIADRNTLEGGSDEFEPVSARTMRLSLMPRKVDPSQRERRHG